MKDYQTSKIEKIIEQRKEAHQYFLERSKVYNSFVTMEEMTYRNSALNKKEKELIATGISVAINCESCMEWHIGQALKDGATEEQVLEAIEVGIEMSGGPGTVAARFAMSVLKYLKA